jgi:hypothetical protein
MDRRDKFVADGRERIARDEIKRIRREVRARYADRLAAGGLFRRLWLRMKTHREIERQLNKIAPRDGLYAKR